MNAPGGVRPVRGPRLRDMRCQTPTPAAPGADATAHMSGFLAGRANQPD